MKISRKDATIRQVDDSLVIESLFDGKDFQFDMVIGRNSGYHPLHVNHVSDRAYFVLAGELTIRVGDKVHHTKTHDLILVPQNTPHSVDGKGEYLIITAPPFKPENEEVIS